MDTRTTLSRRRSSAFRRLGWLAVVGMTTLALLGPGAGLAATTGNAGAIWTTAATCNSPAPQDQNLYSVGDTVHIRGSNLDASTLHYWRIVAVNVQGKPVIDSGTATTDGVGYFWVAAHVIAAAEAGAEYSVDVDTSNDFHGAKNDNYRVAALAPQFGSLVVTKALAGDLSGFAGGDFTFSVTCADVSYGPLTINLATGSKAAPAITAIPAGAECTVTETARADPGTYGSWGDIPAAGHATIVANEPAGVTITNTRSYSPPQPVPSLTIDKSVAGNTNGTDLDLGVPSAKIGDVLTFTLAYTLTNGPVTGAVLTDVLPEGYGAPSAITGGGTYDPLIRTITWPLGTGDDPRRLSESGSVSYQVVVLEGANELAQPLHNVATIVSDDTAPSSDAQDIAVQGGTEAATATPKPHVTPPPTDILPGTPAGPAGDSWRLALFGIAALLAVTLLLTPAATKRSAGRRR